ncbi:hypothetical protein ACJX0J_016638, partial [Zea mays]
TAQAVGSDDGDKAEEEKAFLVPSAAVFPHGMSAAAAGLSLAVAKKKEFSKSPSNSMASSGGTDGGSSVVLWPEQLHAQNGAPARVEAMEPVIALTACTNSVAAYNHDATNYYLARLGEMVFNISLPREITNGAVAIADDAMALRVLNVVTPIPRFLHFTLNERVLCAFDGHDCVH